MVDPASSSPCRTWWRREAEERH
uniref:Uncharacterized protein n=1 Tax=Arundo donax TaxID=35708 RepID=A0A0A8Y5Y9_ARUDO